MAAAASVGMRLKRLSLCICTSSRILRPSAAGTIKYANLRAAETAVRTDFSRSQSTSIPTKPKKSLTAYQIFVQEKLKNKPAGDLPPKELMKKVAEDWNSLDDHEKEPYYERSDLDKENWYKECAEYEMYLDSLTEVQRTRIKLKEILLKSDSKERRKLSKNAPDDIAQRMPKRPGSIFQMFLAQEMKKGSLAGVRGPELFNAAGAKWREISDEEKVYLREQRDIQVEKYLKDLEVWKNS